MTKIKFGTDGWRAIIGEEYTVENVARVSIAVADWLIENNNHPSVLIGHDCRFAGELFAETAAKVLASKGVLVKMAKGFVSTPMVSLGVVKEKISLGIVITASHNPPSYNGYKLKGDFGGPLLQDDITDVENRIPDINSVDYTAISMEDLVSQGKVVYINLEDMYCKHAEANFDLDAIDVEGREHSNSHLAFLDALNGRTSESNQQGQDALAVAANSVTVALNQDPSLLSGSDSTGLVSRVDADGELSQSRGGSEVTTQSTEQDFDSALAAASSVSSRLDRSSPLFGGTDFPELGSLDSDSKKESSTYTAIKTR